jgi:protein-S-isoprenylcysteine O-methyltransferase Ste14
MGSLDRTAGRAYFGAQALGGAIWWVLVVIADPVRGATLGPIHPVIMGLLDVPLFVIASALGALGLRWAAALATAWTVLVTVGMVALATLTGLAGWGAVAMIACSCGSLAAAMLVIAGRIPVERFLVGPLAFRSARRTAPHALLAATGAQMLLFWTLFLVVIPLPVIALERRWGVSLPVHGTVATTCSVLGAALLIAASALGAWSALTMARIGRGTPLPSAMPHRLVVAGPYRWVRNPMAVAGIAQGLAVGIIGTSWLILAYSFAGAVLWHQFVRPPEEDDLAARFGDEYSAYRKRVRCWVPRLPPVPVPHERAHGS